MLGCSRALSHPRNLCSASSEPSNGACTDSLLPGRIGSWHRAQWLESKDGNEKISGGDEGWLFLLDNCTGWWLISLVKATVARTQAVISVSWCWQARSQVNCVLSPPGESGGLLSLLPHFNFLLGSFQTHFANNQTVLVSIVYSRHVSSFV